MTLPTSNVHVVQLNVMQIWREMSDKGRTFSADEQMRKIFDEWSGDQVMLRVERRLAFMYTTPLEHKDNQTK